MFANQFAVTTTGRSATVAGEVRRIVREDLKAVLVTSVMTMDDLVDASLVPERMIATLSGVFGGLGASPAALGLYGLLAYTVARRTNEIGIRIALGATQSDISRKAAFLAGELLIDGLLDAAATRHGVAHLVHRLASDLVPALFVGGRFDELL